MRLIGMRWSGAFHHIAPYTVVFADTPNWTNLLSNQLPFAVLIVILGLAGHKKIWRYGHQYDETVQRLEAEKTQIIKDRDVGFGRLEAEIVKLKEERATEIARVRADAEVETRRLADERERERIRAQKYEDYTLRLLETARQAAAVATDAVGKRGTQ